MSMCEGCKTPASCTAMGCVKQAPPRRPVKEVDVELLNAMAAVVRTAREVQGQPLVLVFALEELDRVRAVLGVDHAG